uniref:Glucagon / GIP / secretin / VIP family domain-containing protein n=1 Tax=Mola mola TaxID=94237 RepID=A0A3Q3WU60_MOLML
MASSSKATLILLIYGILMHYSAFCTPIGLGYPKIRLENDAFDEDGNSLSDMGFDSEQIAIRGAPPLEDDAYALFYPQEKRPERHAEEELDRALREILGQLTARHYRHFLMTIRDESEPLSKRHSDGIFTDSYSRYRKQMAVQKYLAAVLGRRYRQRVRNKGRRLPLWEQRWRDRGEGL